MIIFIFDPVGSPGIGEQQSKDNPHYVTTIKNCET